MLIGVGSGMGLLGLERGEWELSGMEREICWVGCPYRGVGMRIRSESAVVRNSGQWLGW